MEWSLVRAPLKSSQQIYLLLEPKQFLYFIDCQKRLKNLKIFHFHSKLENIFMKYIFQYFNIFFVSKNYNFIDIENDPFRRKSFKRLMVHFRLKRSGNAEITITCEFSKVKTKRWENQKLFPKRLKNSPKRKVKNRI